MEMHLIKGRIGHNLKSFTLLYVPCTAILILEALL